MFLAVLSNYFAFEKNYHYYPQVFSKKCKNIEKKKKESDLTYYW